jgi:cytochrome c oxidase cbb3-type subunit I/II
MYHIVIRNATGSVRADRLGPPVPAFNDRIARRFAVASMVWGVIGMAAGLFIAIQLAFAPANLPPYLSFGRLRPVHTNAIVFAFVGNLVFAGIYYSSQRLLAARLPSDRLAAIHFWLWQLIIVAALVTLPLGYTQGKELAELEWPIDLAIALAWIVLAVNFFWLIRRRGESRLYVSIWFYIATIIAVASLHIVNSLAVPVGLLKSYSLFAGVDDALVQWWYGHTAVAFFLTMPVLGIMYYLAPAAAGRPLHSVRIAIVQFWALVFLYGWAAPHHLLNTALPDWAQTLGVAFGLMLLAPSLAGALNGLLTLRGTGARLRTDPVLKFLAAALFFYALAALQAPILATRSASGLLHYSDWLIGHVHLSGLGWNGFMAAALLYWLVPRLWGTQLHSRAAAGVHFYLATVGLLLYVAAMCLAGATQATMLAAENPAGGLTYTFIESLLALDVPYWARVVGGSLYMDGFLIMVWNLAMTIRAGRATDGEVEVVKAAAERPRIAAQPVLVTGIVVALVVGAGLANPLAAVGILMVAVLVALGGIGMAALRESPWHRSLEGRPLAFGLLVASALLIGGVVELVPMLTSDGDRPVKPASALSIEGRDVYLAEGCHGCHSQMIRPFLSEVARYGEVSTAADSAYDHPFQWGSRRIGPDLARIGGRYDNAWHHRHLVDPRSVAYASNMPSYAHLEGELIDFSAIGLKLRALRAAGVPYTDEQIDLAALNAYAEAHPIARDTGLPASSKMVALIAYLQQLGR